MAQVSVRCAVGRSLRDLGFVDNAHTLHLVDAPRGSSSIPMADPVSADPEVEADDARRGDTWFRSHIDGHVLADLRWLGNQYRIMVFRLPERVAVADDCCTESPELARRRADRLVREKFPHDCTVAACAPWVQYSEA
jgi:hypothetical protein